MAVHNPPFLQNRGLWDIENMSVRYITETWMQLSCEQLIVNGPREIKNIQLTIIDKLRGVNFDEKAKIGAKKFVSKMEARNAEILLLRQKSALVRSDLLDQISQ